MLMGQALLQQQKVGYGLLVGFEHDARRIEPIERNPDG